MGNCHQITFKKVISLQQPSVKRVKRKEKLEKFQPKTKKEIADNGQKKATQEYKKHQI